jgi:hypothetical protein
LTLELAHGPPAAERLRLVGAVEAPAAGRPATSSTPDRCSPRAGGSSSR